MRSRATIRECGCHGIASLFQDFQDPNNPLLNTVPPEVIKAANQIVKQASDKGRILKAQQRKYSVSRLQNNSFSNSSVGGWDLLVDMMLLH